jgi:hypothetical protein
MHHHESQADLFWSKVKKRRGPLCWEWQAGCQRAGYGWVAFEGKTQLAHRVAYYLTFGKIPAKLCILHTCDNRRCVNPSHLWIGTRTDNNRDRMMKGRSRPRRGETSGKSKLNNKKVKEIRKAVGKCRDIATKYGVSFGTIARVRSRVSWAHVGD